MQKRRLYKSVVVVGAVILVIGVAVFATFGTTNKWVGRTAIEIRFEVADADTGQPIPNSTIHIRLEEEGGFYSRDREEREFFITTDEKGHAIHFCKSCMCSGSIGTFEDTFVVSLPHWWFHASAAGYSDAEAAYLDLPENRRLVRRGPPFATIKIPILLRKMLPNQ